MSQAKWWELTLEQEAEMKRKQKPESVKLD